MDLESLAIRISRNENLPLLPQVASAALRLSDDPDASARSLEALIESDSAITAKVLRVANSAYYGGHEVSSITRAVTMLGLNMVRSLILAVAYHNLLSRTGSCKMFSKVAFWRHSLAVAAAAKILGKLKNPARADELYCMGMIHDVGMLVFERFCPREFDYAVEYSRRQGIPLYQAEQKVMGLDHAQVGGLLASRWALSPALRCAIEFHHSVEKDVENRETTAYVALADDIAHRAGLTINEEPDHNAFSPLALHVAQVPVEQLEVIKEVVIEEVSRAESAYHVQAA